MTTKRHLLPLDYERGAAARELASNPDIGVPINLYDEFEDLFDGTTPEAQEIVLDWAAQIRDRELLSWGECLRAASIFYFG